MPVLRFVRSLGLWAVLLGLSVCSDVESARADMIANGGFEDPVLLSGQAITFAPGQTLPLTAGPWMVIGDPNTSVYLLQNAYSEPFNDVTQFNAEEGLNSVDLSGPANVGPSAGVQQIVAVAPGQEYALSFYVGRVTPNAGPGGVYPSPATVDVSIDGGPRVSFTNSDVINGRISWKAFTHRFTASGSTATIAFLNGTPLGCNEAGLDGVSLAVVDVGVGDGPAAPALDFAAPHPNPARDATTFRYSLSRAGHVRLAVFDATGRRVRLLRDDEEVAGAHWERLGLSGPGRELPSGLYLVRLETEGRVLTRRLVAIR